MARKAAFVTVGTTRFDALVQVSFYDRSSSRASSASRRLTIAAVGGKGKKCSCGGRFECRWGAALVDLIRSSHNPHV
jgi:hypothetical protein